MGRKAPPGGKVERRVIAGIPVRFVYYPRSKSVEAEPDEDALAAADVHSVLKLWQVIAEWSESVRAGGSGWTACGVPPDDGDPLAFTYDPLAKGWFDGEEEEPGEADPEAGADPAGPGAGPGEVPEPDRRVGAGEGESSAGEP